MMVKYKVILSRIFFWWYYKRVPEFFRNYEILKSLTLLVGNYKHQQMINDGKDEVISNAIKREHLLQVEITNLTLKFHGISQDKIDPINKMMGTNLKGKSTQERDN